MAELKRDLIFDPKPDITAYEVSLLLAGLLPPPLLIEPMVWENMPDEIKRHWR